MRTDRAFTLIEVLLAVVLLAAVVGVCIPFLAGRVSTDTAWSQSAFLVLTDQLIAQKQISHAKSLTFDEYTQLAVSKGWRCRRVQRNFGQEDEIDPLGEWVEITDGVHARLCWAVIEPREKVSP
tara:strand:- start:952 stop:1323 length:372 start_codon:yes stop_codon:yes gene_type:complete